MHPEIKRLTDDQLGLVAVWQLVAFGWTRKQIRCRIADLTRVHDGVLRAGPEQAGRAQRWKAATLTAPDTALSFASAGDHLGVRTWPRDGGSYAVVTRPGSGGPRLVDGVLVHRSAVLGDTEVRTVRGVSCTAVERTLVDLASALAVAQLDAAGLPSPLINVRVAGFEADLYFPDLGLILEIDGPSFHVLKDSDARRTLAWTQAGNTVRRVVSDRVFDDPAAVPGIVRAQLRRGRP